MREAVMLLGLLFWVCALTSLMAYIWKRVSTTRYDYRWEIDFVMARKEMFRTFVKLFSLLGGTGTILVAGSKFI